MQAAFVNGWKPIALAEFWWGAAPKSEIRKHGYFYPACRGKCEPILLHMLRGLAVADNPLLINPAVSLELEILFEDHSIWVVNKPAEMLSVPGIYIQDSAWSRLKSQSNKTADPLVVHRLDMATSGLLVFAKDKASHQVLQDQFIKKTIKKRYTALLDGDLKTDQGQIELPLRVDLDDRPRQLVCYTHGKPALTKYKTVEVKDGKTRVHFWPISGRTHQLRVHAAHSLGLHTPIVGDDLYGTKSDRLYLHAEYLEFTHPKTGELMHFYLPAPF